MELSGHANVKATCLAIYSGKEEKEREKKTRSLKRGGGEKCDKKLD